MYRITNALGIDARSFQIEPLRVCAGCLDDEVIDRFGTDVMIHPHEQEHFHAGMAVTVSSQLFGWLAGTVRWNSMKRLLFLFVAVWMSVLLAACSGSGQTAAQDWTESKRYVQISEDDMKTIYLAGGCFWGVQKFFDQFDGVISTEVGYANGPEEAPTYQDVCQSSGHAETVKIVYDESRVTLTDLLGYYFMVIDPLSVNKQGNDTGIQYRTGIYYTDEEQLSEAQQVYAAEEEKAGTLLAVELEPLQNFFTAEEYHQKYLVKNPGGYCHIPRAMFEK